MCLWHLVSPHKLIKCFVRLWVNLLNGVLLVIYVWFQLFCSHLAFLEELLQFLCCVFVVIIPLVCVCCCMRCQENVKLA